MNRPNLQAFCSTDETRQGLLRPWREGEYTYASDGRVLMRVLEQEGDESNERAPQNVWKHVGHVPPVGTPFLELPEVEQRPCEICLGKGGWPCICNKCGVEHNTPCGDCHGTGKVYTTPSVRVGTRLFGSRYIHLLRGLPNCMIEATGDEHAAAYFHFDGGDGVLMPIMEC